MPADQVTRKILVQKKISTGLLLKFPAFEVIKISRYAKHKEDHHGRYGWID